MFIKIEQNEWIWGRLFRRRLIQHHIGESFEKTLITKEMKMEISLTDFFLTLKKFYPVMFETTNQNIPT